MRSVIAASYGQSEQFGLLVEVAAVIGARPSQPARIELQDIQADRLDPRIMMPSSHKGRGKKKGAGDPSRSGSSR